MTFTLPAEQVLFVCGLISAVGGASVYVNKLIEKAKKPNAEQNRRIEALEKWKADVTLVLDKDKKNIDRLSDEMHLLMKANNALLAHGIDGNSIDPMKESQAEITNYLINK